MEIRLTRAVSPGLKRCRDDETANRKCEQTRCCLGDCNIEVLLLAIETSEEKTHAHDQEQIG